MRLISQRSTVGDEHFGNSFVTTILPQKDNPHRVFYLRQTDGGREVPLTIVAAAQFLSFFSWNRRGKFVSPNTLAADFQLAVGLQVADVGPRFASGVLFAMNVVEVFGTGKIAVKRKIARDFSLTDPVDQLSEQDSMILKFLAGCFTLLSLFEPPEFQRIMLAAGRNIIGNQIIVGDLMPSFGMIPKPADVGDPFPVVIDQYIIQGDNTLLVVAGGGVCLQQFSSGFRSALQHPSRLRSRTG